MGAANRTASLIGAPTDIGASDRGASMGPEALRVAVDEAELVSCVVGELVERLEARARVEDDPERDPRGHGGAVLRRVHEELPEASTVQPVYVEPVTIGLKSGIVSQGDG